MSIFRLNKTTILSFYFVLLALLAGCRSLETPLEADKYLREPQEEDINGVFPDAVYIKTRTQTFNSYHYYIIRDGLIWYKSIDETKEPREWTLFEKTGLPHNPRKFSFAKPKKIVNISADADELAAISEDGRFYRFCFDRIIGRRSNVWFDRQGWPIEEQLFLDERTSNNTAWALGKRNSHVLYYEDPFGNQHHNGTLEIATIYLLLGDGQEICYADTGLPSDFSRNYLGPERGAFKAIALSASASTMFLMNDAGEMYTRIADFDIVGGDPMFFKYTYIPYKSDLPGTNYFSNLSAWALPPEGWRLQNPIPLGGQAAISRFITILQNGQGNGARELRVAGIDGEGDTGYWTKGIFEGQWKFTKVPLYFPPDALLRNGGMTGRRSRSLDTRLYGYRWNGGERDNEGAYEIPNFNILEGSCELRITRGNESCTLTLHPVELWTYQKRDYTPGRSRAPKLFFVTLDIGSYAYNGLSEEFKAYLNKHYGKNNRALFQYILGARTNYVVLWDKDDTNSVLFLTDGSISNYFPDFQNSWYAEYADEVRTFNSPEFVIEGPLITGAEYAGILRKIELNEKLREELKIKVAALEKAKLLTFGVNASYLPLDGILRFSILQFVNMPKIRTIMSFGHEIILVNSAYINTASNTQIWIYEKIIDRLDLRIHMLKALAKQAARGNPASPPDWYSENVAAYWNIAGLPERVSGVFFDSVLLPSQAMPAVLSFTPHEGDLGLFGWYLSAGGSPAYTFFVDPKRSLHEIYSRGGKSPAKRAISLDCTIYTSQNVHDGIEKTIIRRGLRRFVRKDSNAIDVNITFDGENFVIKRDRRSGAGNDEIIFRGKAIP